jgi:hypothetical protein
MPAAFVLTAIGFSQAPGFVSIAGILQRLTIIIGMTWLTLVACHNLNET